MRTVQQLDLPECFEVRGTEKTQSCNPDNIATAKLIKSDTRSCPNCNEGIYKIEGCAQMWCTSCKTPFDWNTGKIIAEIYTTHYFEKETTNYERPTRRHLRKRTHHQIPKQILSV
jgi:hypothetical protein